ncbi:MAG TPA: hypothetical protein VNZ85_20290 [Caulobacter sp.]|nr:hypothetical protein [Caulobacter sp.]
MAIGHRSRQAHRIGEDVSEMAFGGQVSRMTVAGLGIETDRRRVRGNIGFGCYVRRKIIELIFGATPNKISIDRLTAADFTEKVEVDNKYRPPHRMLLSFFCPAPPDKVY